MLPIVLFAIEYKSKSTKNGAEMAPFYMAEIENTLINMRSSDPNVT